MDDRFATEIDLAAQAIAGADALVISAGAGMGVDSGLPDFRGGSGFWKAYPPYARLGLRFEQIASPRWFREDPALAWGFYGHRLELYRKTIPHFGFTVLKRWAERTPQGTYVYTSNVDGQFQRAGFDPDRIVEVHGAIDRMQCTVDCGVGIFPADPYAVKIDEETMRASEPLPTCPSCEVLARPNILMFGDGYWDSRETDAQSFRMKKWLQELKGCRLVVIECGAGRAIPTVRRFSEFLIGYLDALLVRVNPRESESPDGHIAIPCGAMQTLQAIEDRMVAHSS